MAASFRIDLGCPEVPHLDRRRNMPMRRASFGLLLATLFLVTHGVAHSIPMEGSDTLEGQGDGFGGLVLGDLDSDGIVSGKDFIIFRGCYLAGGAECTTADFDGNRVIDLADFSNLTRAFAGGVMIVPEPGALLLVAAGITAIAVGRRRWRASR